MVHGRTEGLGTTYEPSTSEFHPSYKLGTMYFGPELEVDRGRGRGKYLGQKLESQIKTEIKAIFQNTVRFKSDCSLTNGFEMNFMPMTYDYLMEQPWDEFFKVLNDYDFSDTNGGAGLHVHVSRACLTDERNALAGMAIFYDRFWPEMYKFSRRTTRNIHWAERPRIGGYTGSTHSILDRLKYDRGAVNVFPEHTVEFRIFKGTVDPIKFLAAIQITKEIVELSNEMNFKAVGDLNWGTFVERCEKYSELMTYLRRMKLTPTHAAVTAQTATKAMALTEDTSWMSVK